MGPTHTSDRRRPDRLIRILLLGVALCGLAANARAFAADSPGPPPPPELRPAGIAAAQPAVSISAAQMKRIDNLLDEDGIDQTVPAVIATRLGLSQRVVKQLGMIDKVSGVIHGYAKLRDGGILFTFMDYSKTKLAYTYRLDSNFKVLASVVMTETAPSDIADPQAGAKAELAFWAQVANQL